MSERAGLVDRSRTTSRVLEAAAWEQTTTNFISDLAVTLIDGILRTFSHRILGSGVGSLRSAFHILQ